MSHSLRTRLTTGTADVAQYVFADREASARYNQLAHRYEELRSRAQSFLDSLPSSLSSAEKQALFEERSPLTRDERSEMRAARKTLAQYKAQQRNAYQSILTRSLAEEQIGNGQDNVVYVDAKKPERFVMKYSVKSYPVTPQTLLYMQRKYDLLRTFLEPYIPQSGFVLGERRTEPEREGVQPLPSQDNRLTLITLQRRVQGKTMQEMSIDERMRPVLLEQLRDAHSRYLQLKQLLITEAQALGLPPGTLDAKLDLGILSKSETEEIFDPEKVPQFSSPNIMFDDVHQRIQFIDFDMADWNDAKQRVFERIMGQSPVSSDASSAQAA